MPFNYQKGSNSSIFVPLLNATLFKTQISTNDKTDESHSPVRRATEVQSEILPHGIEVYYLPGPLQPSDPKSG